MVSTFGSYLNMLALNLFVYQETGSAVGVAAFLAVRLGCGFLAGLGAGWVAARLPRRAVLAGCHLVQAGTFAALAVVPQGVQLALLPVVAVLAGLLGTISAVVLRSSVPDLVGPERRVAANGLLVTGRAVATAAGFAAGGVLVGWLGYRAAFAIDAATFLAPAIVVLALPMPFGRPAGARLGGRSGARSGGRSGAWSGGRAAGRAEGWFGGRGGSGSGGRAAGRFAGRRAALVALAGAPVAGVIVGVRAADAFGSASHNVGLPVFATEVRPGDPAGFLGLFFSVWAAGLIVAHQGVRLLRRRIGERYDEPGRTERGFLAGTCLMSVGFVAAFLPLPVGGLLVAALVAGIADGYTEITYSTRLQAEPEPARGYAFGFTAMAENGGFGAGMLVAGGLIELTSPLWTAVVLHGAVILLTVGLALRLRHRRAVPLAPTSASASTSQGGS